MSVDIMACSRITVFGYIVYLYLRKGQVLGITHTQYTNTLGSYNGVPRYPLPLASFQCCVLFMRSCGHWEANHDITEGSF